jgi:hypothetical protein
LHPEYVGNDAPETGHRKYEATNMLNPWDSILSYNAIRMYLDKPWRSMHTEMYWKDDDSSPSIHVEGG